MPFQPYELESGGFYELEDGSEPYELESSILKLKTIIKYEMSGSSDTRERPVFSFEFPLKIFAIIE